VALGLLQTATSARNVESTYRLFEWLKKRPNPELVKIDEKLDRANESLNRLTSNLTGQTTTLNKVDDKIDSARHQTIR
jgi:hypothetical protein